jgi:hypothetical protein
MGQQWRFPWNHAKSQSLGTGIRQKYLPMWLYEQEFVAPHKQWLWILHEYSSPFIERSSTGSFRIESKSGPGILCNWPACQLRKQRNVPANEAVAR